MRKRLQKIIDTHSEVDGLEAVAMLTIVQAYSAALAPTPTSAAAAPPNVSSSGSVARKGASEEQEDQQGLRVDHSAFYVALLGDLEGLLTRRVAAYFTDQVRKTTNIQPADNIK